MSGFATCSVYGCENRVLARGWCNKHWQRWSKYGDPTILKMATPGSGCMVNGYPAKQIDGKLRFDHVRIAERVLGKPLPKNAVIHHANEIKTDNRHENLVICPGRAYHNLLHVRLDALKECGNPNWKRCGYCKKYDDPETMRQFRTRFVHTNCRRVENGYKG